MLLLQGPQAAAASEVQVPVRRPPLFEPAPELLPGALVLPPRILAALPGVLQLGAQSLDFSAQLGDPPLGEQVRAAVALQLLDHAFTRSGLEGGRGVAVDPGDP